MTQQLPQLYKLTFTKGDNSSLTNRVEYLRCESQELLVNAINQSLKIPQSEYYGYSKVEIIKADNFPEILSTDLIIEDDSLDQLRIKGLEGKIIGCKKAITKFKSQINDIRQPQKNKCTKEIVNDGFCCNEGYQCENHYRCTICNRIHYTDSLLATIKKGEIPESWKRNEFKQKSSENNHQKLVDKIKECMVRENDNGGRSVLDISTKDREQLMYLATGEYHNSMCYVITNPFFTGKLKNEKSMFCNRLVSCVCISKCNHIWYCPDHILHHEHTQHLTY